MVERPNIVWLVQDHVAWKHVLKTAGPKPELPTYRRIAAEGVAFDHAYTVIPLCGPARASMLTGVYPHQHGVLNNGSTVRLTGDKGLPTGTYNSYLADAGYRCGYFGKWHAGVGTAQDCGFEGFSLPDYGDPYGTPEYAAYLQRFGLPEPVVDVEWRAGGEPEHGVKLMERGLRPGREGGIGHPCAGVFRSPVETTEAYFVSRLASDWIEERAADGDSFVLRVDVWGPHQPYLVAAPYKDKIDPNHIPEYPNFGHDFADRPSYHQRDRAEWRARTGFTSWEEWQPIVARAYEHMEQTDTALGEVLDTLERTGMAANTIIIYTADHGDILASGGGLFDKDAMLTEETMSIPLAIRWPGVTTGNSQPTSELVSNMDVVPTVLDMAGITPPVHMDGASLIKLLQPSPGQGSWRESLMAEHFGHMNYDGLQSVLYWQHYKYVAHLDDMDELYDLEADRFEMRNLVGVESMHDVLRAMRQRLAALLGAYEKLSDDACRLWRELNEDQREDDGSGFNGKNSHTSGSTASTQD